ncbi:hypothetical protein HFK74_19435|uniref:hypothetical protein n=1 Tax=Pseudomonas sp. SbOxS1 TaxID=2723884 RepID=UPI0015D33EAF|nr:hypothetical protein [Pseudomonas sp. SbOxS1]NYU04870.1 hypothetical protein [Pseudomonas sp. SbOxS1]
MLLRDALVLFSTDWQLDLPSPWRSVLGSVEPAAADVAPSLSFGPEPVYPARRASPLPDARADAHVFRAFDGLAPENVRCVLVGQDPYPRIARATGRSFEQGDLQTWPTKSNEIAPSLRCLVQKLAQSRTGKSAYVTQDGWSTVVADAMSGALPLESPQALFDRWQQNGVLCLNAGLTLTRYLQGGAPEQVLGHIPFWAPVVGGVLRHLAARQDRPVVYLLLGGYAQTLAQRIGIRQTAEAAGRWGVEVDEVRLLHPAAQGFLAGPNPFDEVNTKLVALGETAINW